MTTVDFFTPVRFDKQSIYGCVDSVLEFADDFCNLGESFEQYGHVSYIAGKVANVLAERTDSGNIRVFEATSHHHLCPLWLKVTVCIATLGIFPLLMLITKAFLRCFYTFEVVQIQLSNCSTQELTPEQIRKQIDRNNSINTFHEQAQITTKNPFRLIEIDQSTFAGLDLNEEATITVITEEVYGNDFVKQVSVNKTVSLGDVARLVLDQINQAITNKAQESQETLPSCRLFYLPIYDEPLRSYANLGGPIVIRNEEEDKLRWMHRILTALVNAGQIYDFSLDGYGHLIQA